jgi:hypothetical protein
MPPDMPRLQTLLLALALPLALAAGPVAGADARIVPGVSIGGARLGDTSAEISARFGEHPDRLGSDDGRPLFVMAFSRIRGYAYFALPPACAEDAEDEPAEGACDADGPATYILTRSKAQRTALHIGPGVTERTARRRLRGERCSIAYDTDISRNARFCVVRAPGGRARTEYEFSRGRMVSVGILATG